jgi:excisionase family DNA binding protein
VGVVSKEVLNAEEAAEFLGFNPFVIRQKARDGEIPGRKVGREWRFTRRSLLDFIEYVDRSALTERELKKAAEELVSLLTNYYWHEDDEELAALNRVRRLLGWREQWPKCCEAELQADEAEGKPTTESHATYHARIHGAKR